MRRLFLATSLLAATFALPALAGEQDFKLVNKTGYQIDEVYVSRATSKSWGMARAWHSASMRPTASASGT